MATLFRSSRKLHSLRSTAPTQQYLSPIFLQLPSSLRARAFHASPRPQFIAEAVSVSHSLLESLHSTTGLSWVYTLPLFAVVVRTTLFLPISIYCRRVSQKQVSLSPIVQSWTHTLRKETIQEVGHLGPQASQKRLLIKMRQKRIEIYKRWGCQQWKVFAPILQIPVFLSIMEAVRQMCGAHQGFLGMMIRSETETGLSNALVAVDPSLAIEGALWFPNLLIADPQLVLPFVLSATILLNVFGHRARGAITRSKFQLRLERILGILGLAIGPIMLHVPSALLVYWIGSSLSAYVQATILDKMMPIRKPVEACKPKRPWRTGLGAEIMAGRESEPPRATNPDAIQMGPKISSNRRHRGI